MRIKKVKNHHPPEANKESCGLIEESSYYLSHYFKYVAWFIVLATVVSSVTIFLIFGLSFGMLRIYGWITMFTISFMISMFLNFPAKIFLSIVIKSLFFKIKPAIIKREINPCLLLNPDDPVKRDRILRFRQCNVNLYNPTPLHKLQSRLDNIKYNVELRNLISSAVFYSLFLLSSIYLILVTASPMIFYTNKEIKENILNGSYTKTMTFSQIITYKTFVQYLNYTLLPTLLISSDGSSKRKRRSLDDDTRGHTKQLPDNLKKRQVPDDFTDITGEENTFHKGWTMNPNMKLLGKPRLRQVRVKTGPCNGWEQLGSRNSKCAGDLNPLNVETGKFSLKWDPSPPKGLTESQASPWTYRSAWSTSTLPVLGKFTLYPGGGYILELARNIDDARIILRFLDDFDWIDFRTRVIFVEFTLYCANTNLFTVVSLVIERPASGNFILSHEIHTRKFTFLEGELEFVTLIISVLYCMIVFGYIIRESIKITKTSFKHYLKRAFAVIDLTLLLLGAVSMAFIILRSIYVSDLLKKLEKSSNNDFVSFIYADFWSIWSLYLEAIMACCAFFKLIRHLRFRVAFYQLQNILTHCFRRFVDLAIKQFTLYLAFALFFNLMLVNFSEFFGALETSLSTLIGKTVTVDHAFRLQKLSSSSPLCPIFFILFVIFFSMIFINMFIAVICMYFQAIRNIRLTDKYNILDFIKYLLTIRKQKDVLPLREGKTLGKKLRKSFVMRLRGGGNKLAKEKKNGGRHTKSEKKEPEKPYLKEFVSKKLYDNTVYKYLDPGRAAAIKHLMILFLTEDEEYREVLSENCLKALFYCYTADSRGGSPIRAEAERFFWVKLKKKKKLYDTSLFERMKKVVEDLAKEKGLVTQYESVEIMTECQDYLHILEEKLNLLDRKLRSKYNGSPLD